MVFSGLVMLCRLAVCPTSTSPLSVKATIDGVVRVPSEFSITLASPPSMTATHELVVPRSMPIALAIIVLLQVVPCMDGHRFRWSRAKSTLCRRCEDVLLGGGETGARPASPRGQAACSRSSRLLVLALCLVLPLARFLTLALILDLDLFCLRTGWLRNGDPQHAVLHR